MSSDNKRKLNSGWESQIETSAAVNCRPEISYCGSSVYLVSYSLSRQSIRLYRSWGLLRRLQFVQPPRYMFDFNITVMDILPRVGPFCRRRCHRRPGMAPQAPPDRRSTIHTGSSSHSGLRSWNPGCTRPGAGGTAPHGTRSTARGTGPPPTCHRYGWGESSLLCYPWRLQRERGLTECNICWLSSHLCESAPGYWHSDSINRFSTCDI